MTNTVTAALMIVSLLLACLGTGRAILLSGALPAPTRADGIAGLVGLALLTWLAGWLVLAGAYSPGAGWALLVLGAGALLWRFVAARAGTSGAKRARAGWQPGALGLAMLSLGLMAGRVLSEFVVPFYDLCDDLPSYWHFPRLLLETGGFIEPFNFRRMGTLGAVPLLHSFFWRDFNIAAAGMSDAIVGQLLLWGAARQVPDALSSRPQPAWIGEGFGLFTLLTSLTISPWNAMPVLLPMAGALVLILLTRRMTEQDSAGQGIRAAVAWGLVAAWLINLRVSNAAFPAVLWIAAALAAARCKDRQQGARLAIAALATVVGLLPWSLALWRSSGTPLFPLFTGNYRVQGGFSAPLGLAAVLTQIGDGLWMSRVWVVAGLGAVAASRPGTRLLSIHVVVALVIFVAATAAAMSNVDTITVLRYDAPFLAAGVVFFAGCALLPDEQAPVAGDAPAHRRARPLLLCGGLALWLLMPVYVSINVTPTPTSNASVIKGHVVDRGRAAVDAWYAGPRVRPYPYSRPEHYAAAQALLPADARLVSAAETPFLFSFGRQVIHTLDMLGEVSPDPGMPFFQGPERLAGYLRNLGYTHLAFTPPAAGVCLYSRQAWTMWGANGVTYLTRLAPYFLDFMQNEESQAWSYGVIYSSPDLVLIDLRKAQ